MIIFNILLTIVGLGFVIVGLLSNGIFIFIGIVLIVLNIAPIYKYISKNGEKNAKNFK